MSYRRELLRVFSILDTLSRVGNGQITCNKAKNELAQTARDILAEILYSRQEPTLRLSGGTNSQQMLRNLETKPETPLINAPEVTGAVFDFAGFLCTRKGVIELGSTSDASQVAELIKEWGELRRIYLHNARVEDWDTFLRSEVSCKYPTCHSEEYQQQLENDVASELIGTPPAQTYTPANNTRT